NLPLTEQAELVAEATLYLNGNGTGSANTGTGIAASVGYRFGFVAPYVAYDYFQSSSCDAGSLTPAQLATCNAAVDTADSRNFKAGVNFFFNKNLNHLNVEFGVNHGLSAYGPSSITALAAGYVLCAWTASARSKTPPTRIAPSGQALPRESAPCMAAARAVPAMASPNAATSAKGSSPSAASSGVTGSAIYPRL